MKIKFKDFFRALASSENETSGNIDDTMTIIEQTPGLIEGINYVKRLENETTAGREKNRKNGKNGKNGKRKETPNNQKQHEEPNNIESIKLEHEKEKKNDDRDRIA